MYPFSTKKDVVGAFKWDSDTSSHCWSAQRHGKKIFDKKNLLNQPFPRLFNDELKK